jgi:uncharacterized lipoprotein|nr:hypothetical protein [Lysobacter telluris]
MRQFQMHGLSTLRVLAIPALIAVVAGLSGCHWFNRGNPYNMSAQTRPLEVPPDLDKPDTAGAMDAPADTTQSVLRSAVGASAQTAQDSATGFTIAGERDDVFNKVGTALAATEGVTIASKAQLLGTYDVSYQGANFLVRVTKVDAGVYVSAVDPRGMPASGDPATALIAALKTSLGG